MVIALILIGCAVYSTSLTGKFIWDDIRLVERNPDIKSWSNAGAMFTTTLKGTDREATTFYRPVQMLTYLIDYSIWHLNPSGYHVTNAFFHLAAALAVFWLIGLIFKNEWLAFGTALFFLVHPVHTEAVAYISGRADSLAALFMFLAFGFYLKSAGKNIFLLFMGTSYALALLSRENSLILPALILIYHWAFKVRVQKKSFILLILIAATYVLWRSVLSHTGVPEEPSTSTFLQRVPGFLIAFFDYFRLLLIPTGLHMEYGGILFEWNEPKVWMGLTALIGAVVCAMKMKNQKPVIFFSLAWYLTALVPVSNLYPINAYMAEHWLYIPSVGFFIILSKAILVFWRSDKLRFFGIWGGICLLLFYSVQTLRCNWFWHDPVTYYERLLHYAPHSSRVYNNLAEAYHRAGKEEQLIGLLEQAVRQDPENFIAFNNLGNAYKRKGLSEKAKVAYENAIRLNPHLAGAYSNLGQLYFEKFQDRGQAVSLYQKAIEMDPGFSNAYHLLGILYLKEGNSEKAIELFKKALSINPDDAEIYNSLAFVHTQQGDFENAKALYQTAIQLSPRYGAPYHDLAVIYAKEGKFDFALQYARQAAALGIHDDSLLKQLEEVPLSGNN